MARWTRWVSMGAGLVALSGCLYTYAPIAHQARYSTSSRPDPSYYCYDCHGYRYFDPYYDYCSGRGYRYRWADHPRTTAIYRERYVRIKESHPDYGRYRYTPGYRSSDRYREGRDERWREGDRARDRERSPKVRKRSVEKGPEDPGTKKDDSSRERKRPRDPDGRKSRLERR